VIDKKLVRAQIGDEGESAGRIEIHRVRVSMRLSQRINARTGLFDDTTGGLEGAIGIERQDRHRGRAVIRHQRIFSFWIDRDKAWSVPRGGLAI